MRFRGIELRGVALRHCLTTRAIGRGLMGICRVAVACAGLCCALGSPAPAWASAAPPTYVFNIPPQGLPSALLDFSAQVGRQVIVATRLVDRYTTDGVVGTMTMDDALSQILEGTDLSFDVLGSYSVRIVRKSGLH